MKTCPECGFDLAPHRALSSMPSRPLPAGMVRRALPGVAVAMGVLLAGFAFLMFPLDPSYVVLGAPVALAGLVAGAIVVGRRRRRAKLAEAEEGAGKR